MVDHLESLMAEPPIKLDIVLNRIRALNTKPVHNDRLIEIPGQKFVGKGKDYWTFPLTWVSLVCLTQSFRVEMSDELAKWANDHYEGYIEPIMQLRQGEGEQIVTDELLEQINELLPPERSALEPVKRRYQVSGPLLLATAKRFLLLDQQGTGKMTQTATAFKLYPDTLPALIVAPASTLYTWQRELEIFGHPSRILDGGVADRRKAFKAFENGETEILICSYGMLPKHSRVAPYGNIALSDDHRTPKELNEIPWATVCADEVHRAKSPDAVQTRALWAVSNRAPYRWGLTGTPIEGSPLDFWALLHFIDPEAWPSSVKFRDRWCDQSPNFWGGMEVHGIREDRAEEWRYVSEYTWRRKISEGLPPRDIEYRFCELKGKHLKAYNDMEKQLMAEVGESDVVLFAQNHMVKAGRLRLMAQAAIDVEVIGTDDDGNDLIDVTPIDPSPKLDLFEDTLQDFDGTPLIAWFMSVKFMRLAQARLDKKKVPYVVVDGTMNAKSRDQAVQSFQNGEVDLILLSVSAASEGVTLTRAPIAIDVETPWSGIMQDQKGFRNWRIGSEIHDKIQSVVLVTKGTIEEKQLLDHEEKMRQRDQVIAPDATS